MKRLTMVLLLALIPPLSGAALSVHIDVQQGALLAKDTRFTPGVQLSGSVGAGVGVGDAVRLDVTAGIAHVSQSAAIIGVVYRGLVERRIDVAVDVLGRPGGFGFGVFGSATLAAYDGTTLLFFYPTLGLYPVFRLPVGERLTIEWRAPIAFSFRTDLDLALSFRFSSRLVVEIPSP
jgi:hypothetical protein